MKPDVFYLHLHKEPFILTGPLPHNRVSVKINRACDKAVLTRDCNPHRAQVKTLVSLARLYSPTDFGPHWAETCSKQPRAEARRSEMRPGAASGRQKMLHRVANSLILEPGSLV